MSRLALVESRNTSRSLRRRLLARECAGHLYTIGRIAVILMLPGTRSQCPIQTRRILNLDFPAQVSSGDTISHQKYWPMSLTQVF